MQQFPCLTNDSIVIESHLPFSIYIHSDDECRVKFSAIYHISCLIFYSNSTWVILTHKIHTKTEGYSSSSEIMRSDFLMWSLFCRFVIIIISRYDRQTNDTWGIIFLEDKRISICEWLCSTQFVTVCHTSNLHKRCLFRLSSQYSHCIYSFC